MESAGNMQETPSRSGTNSGNNAGAYSSIEYVADSTGMSKDKRATNQESASTIDEFGEVEEGKDDAYVNKGRGGGRRRSGKNITNLRDDKNPAPTRRSQRIAGIVAEQQAAAIPRALEFKHPSTIINEVTSEPTSRKEKNKKKRSKAEKETENEIEGEEYDGTSAHILSQDEIDAINDLDEENLDSATEAEVDTDDVNVPLPLPLDVPFEQRREELEHYLELFGYQPNRTILQVHLAGLLGKRRLTEEEKGKRQKVAKRYGGTSFVVVGRSHDPTLENIVVQPLWKRHREEEETEGSETTTRKKRKQTEGETSSYIGYLSKETSSTGAAPHELLPLDFTPTHFEYPSDWKQRFRANPNTYLITLHVPVSFVKDKNALMRQLYKVGKTGDVKKEWKWIDGLAGSGFHRESQTKKRKVAQEQSTTKGQQQQEKIDNQLPTTKATTTTTESRQRHQVLSK